MGKPESQTVIQAIANCRSRAGRYISLAVQKAADKEVQKACQVLTQAARAACRAQVAGKGR